MLIVFKKGDQFPGALIAALKKKKISSVFFSGLGGFLKAELAFYDLEKKKYMKKKFNGGPYEVISLTGNVIPGSEGDLISHCHAVLGKNDFNVFGGHLIGAIVGGTLEINVIPLKNKIRRSFDPKTGLNLIHS